MEPEGGELCCGRQETTSPNVRVAIVFLIWQNSDDIAKKYLL